jgi:hypothetical protein
MGADRVQSQPKDSSEPANTEKLDAQDKMPEPSASYHSPAGLSMAGASHPGDIRLSRANLLFLQRTIGNRGVARLMRKKGRLTPQEGKDGDETGRMVGRVMHRPASESSAVGAVDDSLAATAQIHRLPGHALGQGAPAGLSLMGGAIQPKLSVGARRAPQQAEDKETGAPNGRPVAESKTLPTTAQPESKPEAEAETASPMPAAPAPVPATKPLAEPQPAAPATEGAATGAEQTATPEAKGPATERTDTEQPGTPAEAKSKAEAEAKEAEGKEAKGKGKEGKGKETAEDKSSEKAGADTAGTPMAGSQPADASELLADMGAPASETISAMAPSVARDEAADGGGAPTEAVAGGEETGPDAEQSEEETERRMAKAAGEKDEIGVGEAAEEESSEETGAAEEAAEADNAVAEMVPGAAGAYSDPATTISAATAESTTESESSPETGGAALEEAERSANEAADEERAAAAEAERPQPSAGEPSPAELASVGATGSAEKSQSAQPAALVDAIDEESAEPPAAETGPSSVELMPAERDAATASMTEGAGAASEPSGGGGGGGAAIAEKPEPEVPDVSASDPAQAMAQISNLPPGKMVTALTGVNAAITISVGEQRAQLAENPPETERPSGSPITKRLAVKSPDAPVAEKAAPPKRIPEGQSKPTPQPKPTPAPPPSPAQSIATPQIKGDEKGEMSDADISKMSSSISGLPTRDPALVTSAGTAPTVALEGSADPAQMQEQRANLERSIADVQAQGRRDAAQPMGEGDIYPTVPQETLRANVPARGGAGSAASGGGDAELSGEIGEAVSMIAEQKSGGEIQSAVIKAQGDMAAERAKHNETVVEEQTKSREEIARLEAENASQQQGERSKALAEVKHARQDWTAEQQKAVEKRREEADQVNQKGATDIETAKTEGEAQAARSIETGNQEAAAALAEGERKAEAEKKRGEEESSGFFGWLSSKATAFFNSIKEGIKAAMDFARRAVKAAIEKAKQLAVAAIEKARQAIVSAIRWVGDRLIAIADKLLADFPGLRDRFRNFIKDKVAAAEAAVNRLADALKAGVQKALDRLGAALDAALGLLEKGLLAYVNVVGAVVQGAIKAAKAVADAIGFFITLIKDIAANPGQWIKNLGAAIMDGIKNHLWKAFKTAVMNWFNQKLDEVLGLSSTIWGILTKGGVKQADIGLMAWEGVKSAIPPTLIQLLIEKLVAMIVPAAGAVMVIIEGLQAAWGAVSRILQAIQRFIAFLKAVKGGNAGPQFVNALAAAALAVIDFVANWLIRRIRKPAAKVGGAIKAMAKRILQKINNVAKKIGAKIKGAAKKIGAKLKKIGAKIKGKFKKITGKSRKEGEKPKKPQKSKQQKAEDRLDKAVKAIRPQVERLLARGSSKFYLRAKLLYWRLRYRLSALTLNPDGQIVARVNPSVTLANGKELSAEELGKILEPIFIEAELEYRDKLLEHPETKAVYDEAKRKFEEGEVGALQGAPRDLQQWVLQDVKPPATPDKSRTTVQVEEGVKVSFHESGSLGQAEVKMGSLSSYDTMLSAIKSRAKDFGISESDIASVLTGNPKTIDVKIATIMEQLPPAANKTQERKRDSLMRTLRRASFLMQTLEPARKGGIASATAVASSLAAGGHSELKDILGPEGELAPMTPKGAVSNRDTAETRAAQAERVKRVGNIFATLLNIAQQGKIVTNPGGGDLSGLAEAIRTLLENRLKSGKLDPLHIDALKAQIKAVLANYHGR